MVLYRTSSCVQILNELYRNVCVCVVVVPKLSSKELSKYPTLKFTPLQYIYIHLVYNEIDKNITIIMCWRDRDLNVYMGDCSILLRNYQYRFRRPWCVLRVLGRGVPAKLRVETYFGWVTTIDEGSDSDSVVVKSSTLMWSPHAVAFRYDIRLVVRSSSVQQ